MKKSVMVIVLVLMFGWAVYHFVLNTDDLSAEDDNNESGNSTDIEVGLELGNMAPDITVKTFEGEDVHLSDFRGERVMLNFWASWCGPCRAEMPDMEKFHQNTDVKILAVNLIETESNEQQVLSFIEEYGLTFPVFLDEGNAAATTYRIQPVPTTFLINSDGTIHNKAFGALNYELMVQEFAKMK